MGIHDFSMGRRAFWASLKRQGLITVQGDWIDIDTILLGENPGKRLRIREMDLKKRIMKSYKKE